MRLHQPVQPHLQPHLGIPDPGSFAAGGMVNNSDAGGGGGKGGTALVATLGGGSSGGGPGQAAPMAGDTAGGGVSMSGSGGGIQTNTGTDLSATQRGGSMQWLAKGGPVRGYDDGGAVTSDGGGKSADNPQASDQVNLAASGGDFSTSPGQDNPDTGSKTAQNTPASPDQNQADQTQSDQGQNTPTSGSATDPAMVGIINNAHSFYDQLKAAIFGGSDSGDQPTPISEPTSTNTGDPIGNMMDNIGNAMYSNDVGQQGDMINKMKFNPGALMKPGVILPAGQASNQQPGVPDPDNDQDIG